MVTLEWKVFSFYLFLFCHFRHLCLISTTATTTPTPTMRTTPAINVHARPKSIKMDLICFMVVTMYCYHFFGYCCKPEWTPAYQIWSSTNSLSCLLLNSSTQWTCCGSYHILVVFSCPDLLSAIGLKML